MENPTFTPREIKFGTRISVKTPIVVGQYVDRRAIEGIPTVNNHLGEKPAVTTFTPSDIWFRPTDSARVVGVTTDGRLICEFFIASNESGLGGNHKFELPNDDNVVVYNWM